MSTAARIVVPCRRNARWVALCALLLVVGAGSRAEAHRGPPFPVAVDQRIGPYLLSVWADPDIGTASFYLGVESPPRLSDDDPRVQIVAWPKTGRLSPVTARARPQRDGSYLAQVDFDRGELWEVRVDVSGTRGTSHFQFEVEATPPGYGRWDVLIYAGPFLLLLFLALVVGLKRHTLMARQSAGADA